MKRWVAALLLVSHTAVAEPVVYLPKGSITPYDGFLFDRKREADLRLVDQELSYYKALNASLTNINKLQEDNLSKFDEKIKIRDEKIEEQRKSNLWITFGSFMLGCAVTTLLVFGVSNVQK
jgi:hypothetical protein